MGHQTRTTRTYTEISIDMNRARECARFARSIMTPLLLAPQAVESGDLKDVVMVDDSIYLRFEDVSLAVISIFPLKYQIACDVRVHMMLSIYKTLNVSM